MHHHTSANGKSNVFGAVLVAAAVGAVAGMLFAPKRGEETRDDLKQKYNDMKNKTQDKAHQAKDKLDEGIDTARNKVHQAADKSKTVADKAAGKAKDSLDDASKGTSLSEEIQKEHAKRNRPTL